MIRLILYGMMLGVAVVIMGNRSDPSEVLFWALMAAKMIFDLWEEYRGSGDADDGQSV